MGRVPVPHPGRRGVKARRGGHAVAAAGGRPGAGGPDRREAETGVDDDGYHGDDHSGDADGANGADGADGADGAESRHAQRRTRDWRYFHAGPRHGGAGEDDDPGTITNEDVVPVDPIRGGGGSVAAPAELQAQALSNLVRVLMSSTAALPSAEKWCKLRGLPPSQAPSVVTVARHLHQLASQNRRGPSSYAQSKDWTALLNSTFQPAV